MYYSTILKILLALWILFWSMFMFYYSENCIELVKISDGLCPYYKGMDAFKYIPKKISCCMELSVANHHNYTYCVKPLLYHQQKLNSYFPDLAMILSCLSGLAIVLLICRLLQYQIKYITGLLLFFVFMVFASIPYTISLTIMNTYIC